MIAIKFENVSKKYKLYSKGGLYLRDRLTHALGRLNPFNGRVTSHGADSAANRPLPSVHSSQPLALGTPNALERDFWALKNVSFEIKQGESVGFIGRNGAGKSTILKLLAGVTKASSGTAEVNGKVAALIEVGAGFHPELTGRENVFLNGSILGLKKTEIDKAFDSIVSFAELEDFIDTPVKHYSSGMYVRLGFAIAAHTNPDIFLIDEVLSVGDEAFQKKCLNTLAEHRAAGKTMILVSHNLDTVEEVCDRCIYLNHGEICYDGRPADAIKVYRERVQSANSERLPLKTPLGQEAQIINLIFRNNSGKEVSTFQTGDDLIIEIRYHAHQRIDNPSIGVMFHDSNNTNLMGFNTRTTSYLIEAIEGEGSVYCRLRDLPFRDGMYQVSVSIADYACEKIYDHHRAAYRFHVECGEPYTYGALRSKGEWAHGSAVPWFGAEVSEKLTRVRKLR
jgi:ABC-type polysaccharide/polyol phosphate transport system ATPase subunit